MRVFQRDVIAIKKQAVLKSFPGAGVVALQTSSFILQEAVRLYTPYKKNSDTNLKGEKNSFSPSTLGGGGV